ncbi:Mariner Mos1 transposase [Eumeta japonica]|uniref:Mariner Mos1 transposase n=1 Tax=Eumeta variegata TaxID=151549 RepID=A0A4C1W4Y5_EUMVA|nr:Mariner Mos1 transposase [Eumeta japonica]
MKKLCSRWIPHNLTEAQKTDRVTWCNAMYTRFKGASKLVWDVLTDDETWTHCYDPKTKQQSTIWIYRDEPKLSKVARERSASKRMIASFFNKTGHVANVTLENCRNVSSDWYTTIFWRKLLTNSKNNRKRRMILSHDNASSHTAKQTNKFLKEKNVELKKNAVYSPDLGPCDFLFAKN